MDAQRLSSGLSPLWRAVHARLSSGLPVSTVKVGPLDLDQRSALADLLGAGKLPGEHASISMRRLDEALEAMGLETREVVTRLIGPIGDRAAARRLAAAERDELWDWLTGHDVVTSQPALLDWVEGVRRNGLIGGSPRKTRDELGKALKVLRNIPANGVPLPKFADDLLGDTHALDEGKRLAGLVMKALAAIYDTGDRRELLERAGIAGDELSSTVLAAGFRSTSESVAGRILRACAEGGQAASLTLQQVRAADGLDIPDEVWVFENPSVLAMALQRFGTRCPPMVCTSGWPSGAGMQLLRRLTGARLRYHGDFDGEGLRIAATVVARTGAEPWRMTSADYLDAVSEGPGVGRVTPVPWDEDLAGHLTRLNITVSEERVALGLLTEIEHGE